MLLKESVDMKNQCLGMVFFYMKKNSHIKIEGKRQGYTLTGIPRHVPLVTLLLWHNMVYVDCLVWAVALQQL